MNIIKCACIGLLCFFVLLPGCQQGNCSVMESVPEEISCPGGSGSHGGHLQGIATDGKTAIFWSHTKRLVKTDLYGNLLKAIDVRGHHGDLDYYDQKIYVAVNFGKFNAEPGQADSWVYVYSPNDLSLISKHAVPEVVHGAGGMAIHNGRFIVVGGLPGNREENYVYEYDPNFNFVKRHIIKSGQTQLGIQTAAWFDGYWWFGCYGLPNNPGLLKTDDSFNLVATYDLDFSIGIIGIKDDKFLRGESIDNKAIITYVRPQQ
jgi:hypothetical protein